ncbi:MAG: PorV/PorQ family protein [Salibacteraceae bacterium]
MQVMRIQWYRLTGLMVVGMMAVVSGHAQEVRKYSNEFLSIGVGARSLGMSNSTVATIRDVDAGYWNPAGLTGVQNNLQVSAMHSEYFAGISKFDYGAIATPIDSMSTLGISVIRFAVDDIPNTTQLIDAEGNVNYDRITSFSAADYGFLFSYARKMKVPGLSIGGNAKIVYRRVGDMASAWGFGLDAGLQYQYKKWQFGAMGRDITSTFTAWTFNLNEETREVFTLTDNEIPENSLEVTLPRLILGVGRQFDIKERFSITPEINFDVTFDGQRPVAINSDPVSIDPHMGVEASYLNLLYLRLGVGNIQQVKAEIGDQKELTYQPNMGVGIRLKGISIDYALTDIGDQSVALFSNVFSLRLEFNKRKK